MTWRTAIGLKPTSTDLALDLLKAAKRLGLTGWRHDAADNSIRNGDAVINLANIHLEYAAAPRPGRRILMQKYLKMLQIPPISKLWSLGQTKIFPLLRSRYDRVTLEIDSRRNRHSLPPRAGRLFIGNLEQILGYDHGQSITQVTTEILTEWGISLETAIDRALVNLRGLPKARWQARGDGVWQVESPEGYTESLMQISRVFDDLPARGTPLVMIPNRGVLYATGSDEPGGVTALLAEARKSLQEAPWPLCSDLFRISSGIQLFVPSGDDANALASIQRLDISSVYAAQKTALEAHCDAIQDDIFVATYGLLTKNSDPNQLQSWSSWAEGVRALLPQTDLIGFAWDLSGSRKNIFVPWANAAAIVGHYFKSTEEDPPRTRVDEFPTPTELAELQKHVI